MTTFYEPDLGSEPDSPFARDQSGMTKGIGAALRASEKRAHLLDIARDHLVDECCQEILAPEEDQT